MAKKKTGYVELYWTCPNCEGENLGSITTCGNCGKPQPKNADFYQGGHQQLLKDEEKLKRAKAGADIHCAFCGTRNPGGTKHCSQCGSDLSEGLHRDSAGRMVGAFKEGMGDPIECSNCGILNPYVNRKCSNCGKALSHKSQKKGKAPSRKEKAGSAAKSKKGLVIGGVVLLFLCALIYFVFLRTNELAGVVTAEEWQRSIAIESFEAVEREDWLDEIPADAELLTCSEEVRSVQSEAPITGRADEVCGTPYTVETGGGFGEVVQDCEYQIYADFCTYTALDWVLISTVEAEGDDFSPRWFEPALLENTRLGERSESYTCFFDVDGERYSYETSLEREYQLCSIGSTWTLTVNALGAVTSIER